jgi:hypothetical protein
MTSRSDDERYQSALVSSFHSKEQYDFLLDYCGRLRAERDALRNELDGYQMLHADGCKQTVDALRAAIQAATELHTRIRDGAADKLEIEPYPGDICSECGMTWPCPTLRALAAAVPHIEAAIREKIAAEIEGVRDSEDHWERCSLTQAADIARGGSR